MVRDILFCLLSLSQHRFYEAFLLPMKRERDTWVEIIEVLTQSQANCNIKSDNIFKLKSVIKTMGYSLPTSLES